MILKTEMIKSHVAHLIRVQSFKGQIILKAIVTKESLQGSKFDVIIRKIIFRNTPDMIKSGQFRNNDTTSKKVSGGFKNLTFEKKCKNKVCRY